MPKSNIFHSRRAAETFLIMQKFIFRDFRHIRYTKESVFNDVADRSIA